MPVLVLKANANKTWGIICTLLALICAGVLAVLYYRQDIPGWLMLLGWLLLSAAYWHSLRDMTSANAKLTQASLLLDGRWRLDFSNGQQQYAYLKSNSLFTIHVALLHFKIERNKSMRLFLLHTKDNQEQYHALAQWWLNGC